MSYINKHVIVAIDAYKSILENEINKIICKLRKTNPNLLYSGLYKFFSTIYENIKMDLLFLSILNPEYDVLGYAAIKRNLRTSIEAFYDLYNLVYDESYLELLRFQSKKDIELSPNIINIYKEYIEQKRLLNINRHYLTIAEKGEIAKNKNKLQDDRFNVMKEIGIKANAYIHCNIFVPKTKDRQNELKKLIHCDCILLCDAFILLDVYAYSIMKYGTEIDAKESYELYKKLWDVLVDIPWILE